MNKISHASVSFLQMQACQWSQPGDGIESGKLVRLSERLADIYYLPEHREKPLRLRRGRIAGRRSLLMRSILLLDVLLQHVDGSTL